MELWTTGRYVLSPKEELLDKPLPFVRSKPLCPPIESSTGVLWLSQHPELVPDSPPPGVPEGGYWSTLIDGTMVYVLSGQFYSRNGYLITKVSCPQVTFDHEEPLDRALPVGEPVFLEEFVTYPQPEVSKEPEPPEVLAAEEKVITAPKLSGGLIALVILGVLILSKRGK